MSIALNMIYKEKGQCFDNHKKVGAIMAKEKCLICSKEMGLFSPKVQLRNGFICEDCFNRAGFSVRDTKAVQEVRDFSAKELKAVSEAVFSNSNSKPNWDSTDYLIRKARRSIVKPNIALKPHEYCFFYTNGEIGKKRTKARAYKQESRSYKTITGKRVTHGTVTGQGSETYYEKTPCEFYMTSDRFIATVKQGTGFVIKYDKVFGISLHSDALEINDNGKAIIVFMYPGEMQRFICMWELMKKLAERGITEDDILNNGKKTKKKIENKNADDLVIDTEIATDHEVAKEDTAAKKEQLKEQNIENRKTSKAETKVAAANTDPVSEIRRYKALLDEGIITQDEFDKKKKQLLSI